MHSTSPKFAIFGNTYQVEKSASLIKLLVTLQSFSARIAIEQTFYDFIHGTLPLTFTPDETIRTTDFTADFVISLGGDGTFLKSAAYVGSKGIPIIGINTGHLGFLADVAPGEIEEVIDGLFKGRYTIERRSVLRVTASHKRLSVYPCALNEVAILKHDNSSMINIRAYVDSNYLNTYKADGLLVTTPTGSTGYNLSAGGPIVAPNSRSIVLSPVAAHSLNVRPIVLNDDCTIKLETDSRNHSYLISIDGRSQSLPEGAVLTIRKAPYSIYVVKKPNSQYFDTLRNKLMWGADKRL